MDAGDVDYDVPWVCKVVTVARNGFSDDGDIDDLELPLPTHITCGVWPLIHKTR